MWKVTRIFHRDWQEAGGVMPETAVGGGAEGWVFRDSFRSASSWPLVAVYREFAHAWMGVFNASMDVRWQAFPAPAAGMIFTSLLLSLLPVIFCALVCFLRTTPAVRVRTALGAAKAEHKAMLERLSQDKTIRLFSEDPIREATRFLLDFLGQAK